MIVSVGMGSGHKGIAGHLGTHIWEDLRMIEERHEKIPPNSFRSALVHFKNFQKKTHQISICEMNSTLLL